MPLRAQNREQRNKAIEGDHEVTGGNKLQRNDGGICGTHQNTQRESISTSVAFGNRELYERKQLLGATVLLVTC